ncbi:ArpU family phage packaging/lysis transcriptional regulator [Weissella viridescens]|uniref:ArpU family phage packaging/lysis transcriptional regulator n=1 Tax=Weissella viridescens TaxID=1629 RepID=UPI00352716A9
MALLPDINEKQTIENVRNFFNKDFPRLQNMAHISYVEIKSPIITGMPTGAKTGNSNEDKLTNHTYAKSVLDDVLQACRTMSYPYRDIMELKYFKGLSWFEITERLGYSTRRGHELINDAFLQFAYAFADTEDFRVFQ